MTTDSATVQSQPLPARMNTERSFWKFFFWG